MDSIRRIEELAARKAKAKKAKAKPRRNYVLGKNGGVTYNNSPEGIKAQENLAELYKDIERTNK